MGWRDQIPPATSSSPGRRRLGRGRVSSCSSLPYRGSKGGHQMQVPESFHQVPVLLGDAAIFKRGVHEQFEGSKRSPPTLALLPRQRQSGEKGGDQLPLVLGWLNRPTGRERRTKRKPQVFTYCEGEGEGVLYSIPPGMRHPSRQAPQPRLKVGSRSPGVQPPQQLCCSSRSFFEEATVVWLSRGEDSLRRARRRLRPGAPGLWSPSPKPSLCRRRKGTRDTVTPSCLRCSCSTPSVQVHFF